MNKSIVYESIDRLLQVEVRLPFLVRGTIPRLYRAARGEGLPLTRQIAEAIVSAISRGQNRVLLVTGFYEPDIFPCGESDGLYGAVALGCGLSKLGAKILFGVEPECANAIEELARCLDVPGTTIALSREKDQRRINADLEKICDMAIFAENPAFICAGRGASAAGHLGRTDSPR